MKWLAIRPSLALGSRVYEERANARGESLVRHGRSGHHQPTKPSWHVDLALSTGLEWLAEEGDVAAMLNIRTHRGEDLSEAARVHYDKAMERFDEGEGFLEDFGRVDEAFALLAETNG